jgi:hypothetical protein
MWRSTRRFERPQDLAAHACIVQRTYAPRSKWRFEWSGDLIEIEIAPRIVRQRHDGGAVAGAGRDRCCHPAVVSRARRSRSGKLVELLGEAGLPAINVFATFPHHRASLSKIRVLIEELREVVA